MPALPDAFDTCQTPVVVRHPSFRDSEQGKLKEALAGLFNNVRGLPWVPQARAVVATSAGALGPHRRDRRRFALVSKKMSLIGEGKAFHDPFFCIARGPQPALKPRARYIRSSRHRFAAAPRVAAFQGFL